MKAQSTNEDIYLKQKEDFIFRSQIKLQKII